MGDRFTINLYGELSTRENSKNKELFRIFFYNLIDWYLIDNNPSKKNGKKRKKIFFSGSDMGDRFTIKFLIKNK